MDIELWLKELKKTSHNNSLLWLDPLINYDKEDKVYVLEWWFENKKLTFYLGEGKASYIKIWDYNLYEEREDLEENYFLQKTPELFIWLYASPMPD
jgi:hypothetical protein